MSDVLVLNADSLPLDLIRMSTMTWQDAVTSIYKGAVTPLHYYDEWCVHSPSVHFRVPSVVMTNVFVKVGRTVKFNSEMVYLRDEYRCQYCGERFHSSALTDDHVVPKKFGGKSVWSNIVAACSPCNSRRGCNTKIQPKNKPYRPSYYELVEKRKKFLLTIPHETWAYYLNWPEDKLRISSNRK